MEQSEITQASTLQNENMPISIEKGGSPQVIPQGIETQTKSYPRPRRVGSFTMGLSLIGFGILLLICLYQDLNYTYILAMIKLTPFILISLGCEILVYNIGFKYEKLKYDVLSFFICGGLILLAIYLCSVAVYFENFSWYY